MAKRTGVVKSFSEKKGSGFISSDEQDFEVHSDDIDLPGLGTLEEGEVVDFEDQPNSDRAIKVTPKRDRAS